MSDGKQMIDIVLAQYLGDAKSIRKEIHNRDREKTCNVDEVDYPGHHQMLMIGHVSVRNNPLGSSCGTYLVVVLDGINNAVGHVVFLQYGKQWIALYTIEHACVYIVRANNLRIGQESTRHQPNAAKKKLSRNGTVVWTPFTPRLARSSLKLSLRPYTANLLAT